MTVSVGLVVLESSPSFANEVTAFVSESPRFAANSENSVAGRVAPRFAKLAKGTSGHALILVVGGGALGSGTEQLYRDPSLTLVGTDVYASPNTQLVADAHRLPFADSCFDGIWIQAVLEHVLDPHIVAAELYRVLRPQGVIYADTPFMQQVHEKAYDFTRFTLSGHRWLFRRFDELEAGAVGGAGTAAAWSIRYLWRALGTGDMLATLLTAPVFWLRYLDRVADSGPNADAASSVYFLGRKSEKTLSPKDMPAYYAAKDRARPEPQTADGGIMVQSRSGLRRLMSIVPRSSFRFFRRLQGD